MDTTSRMRELVTYEEKATAIKLETQLERARLERLSIRLEERIQQVSDDQKIYRAA